MKLTAAEIEILKQVPTSSSDNFLELARLARLDPRVDFRNTDLRDVDFGEADTSGWDFSGSDLTGANLSRTRGALPETVGARVEGVIWPESRNAAPDIPAAPPEPSGSGLSEASGFVGQQAVPSTGKDTAVPQTEREQAPSVFEFGRDLMRGRNFGIGGLLGMLSTDLAIDFGDQNAVVYVKGRGVVLNELSVVAIKWVKGRRQFLAAGDEAGKMVGRTHGSIETIRPLRDGIVADFDAAEDLIKYFIRKVHNRGSFASPRIIMCVPSGSTSVERRAIEDAAKKAGASRVGLIATPVAAALGAGIGLGESDSTLIVHIDRVRTQAAVVNKGHMAYSRSISVGGDKMDEAIIGYIRRNHNLLVGESSAERIKREIGSACMPEDGEGRVMEIKGRDLMNGVPKEIVISEQQIAESLAEPVRAIVDVIKVVITHVPASLVATVVNNGIVLTGGSALLANLDFVIRHETDMPVAIADDPSSCVILGAGRILEEFRTFVAEKE